MQGMETFVRALGALALGFWLTTLAFRMDTTARRGIQVAAFLVFGFAMLIALFQTAVYFWR
jgi:hypothetical protein